MALPRTLGKQGPEPQAQRALGDSQTAHAAFRRSLLSIPAGRWPSVAGTAQAPGPAPPPPGPERSKRPSTVRITPFIPYRLGRNLYTWWPLK